MKNVLIKYVRDQKKRPIGIVVATYNEGGEVGYGWSLCCKGDKWDKDFGLELAMSRVVPINVLADLSLNNVVPRTVSKDLASMIYRARSYFRHM